jgi:hypothetical protein
MNTNKERELFEAKYDVTCLQYGSHGYVPKNSDSAYEWAVANLTNLKFEAWQARANLIPEGYMLVRVDDMMVPLSDDMKSVFIDGFGEVELNYPSASPQQSLTKPNEP